MCDCVRPGSAGEPYMCNFHVQTKSARMLCEIGGIITCAVCHANSAPAALFEQVHDFPKKVGRVCCSGSVELDWRCAHGTGKDCKQKNLHDDDALKQAGYVMLRENVRG